MKTTYRLRAVAIILGIAALGILIWQAPIVPRGVIDFFTIFGMATAVIIPVYLYFNSKVSSKHLEEQVHKMRDCVTMLKDLKQELPEYGNEIDFIIDEVHRIRSPRGVAESYDSKKAALMENWVKLSKHPKLREKWLKLVAEEYKEWLKADEWKSR